MKATYKITWFDIEKKKPKQNKVVFFLDDLGTLYWGSYHGITRVYNRYGIPTNDRDYDLYIQNKQVHYVGAGHVRIRYWAEIPICKKK